MLDSRHNRIYDTEIMKSDEMIPEKLRIMRRILYPVTLILVLALMTAALPVIGLSARAFYNHLRFGVSFCSSRTDRDGDWIDDSADIMLSARRYVSTKPVYDAEYYADGYPPDGHGVCADVIWQALKGAGYDFKALIDGDISLHPSAYPLPSGLADSNIDFRRVVNLQAYMKRHCETLTCDPDDISAWQRGDFVFYQNHVAVVSDVRNENGIPYIIHHAGYGAMEEDALTAWPIIGHYRWKSE